jgi:hypothetical protein
MSDLPENDRNLRRTRIDYIVIYALVDPRTGEIRYIGKTEKRIAKRLEEHIASPVNSGMRHWIAELHAAGLKPKIEPITCCGQQWWKGKEAFWIRWARIHGAHLLNRDPGGECRNRDGSLNTTGKVKNFIAKRLGKKPFVIDFVKKRRAAQHAWKKLLESQDRRLGPRWMQYRGDRIPSAQTGLDPIMMPTRCEPCQELSIEPTVRRKGRIVRKPT